jgi:membrane associated rhomboid family serine protease
MQAPTVLAGQRLSAPITLLLITCMLLATLPALSFPRVEKLLSALDPQPYMWKPITAAFSHGWAFLPPLTHLAANLALFFFAGPWTERLLGSARYLLLMLAAIFTAGLVRLLSGYGPSGALVPGGASAPSGASAPGGASAFLLACGPVLFYHWMAIRNIETISAFRKCWLGALVLALMLGVPLIYGMWLARQSDTPLLALLQANAIHLSAFLTGILALALWRRRLGPGSELVPAQPGLLDRAAVLVAALLPAGIVVLILLGALRKI